MEYHLPVGMNAWTALTDHYNGLDKPDSYPPRNVESLRGKFKKLRNVKKPTGDPTCPEEVRWAKRLSRSIEQKQDITDFDDDDFDEDTYHAPVPPPLPVHFDGGVIQHFPPPPPEVAANHLNNYGAGPNGPPPLGIVATTLLENIARSDDDSDYEDEDEDGLHRHAALPVEVVDAQEQARRVAFYAAPTQELPAHPITPARVLPSYALEEPRRHVPRPTLENSPDLFFVDGRKDHVIAAAAAGLTTPRTGRTEQQLINESNALRHIQQRTLGGIVVSETVARKRALDAMIQSGSSSSSDDLILRAFIAQSTQAEERRERERLEREERRERQDREERQLKRESDERNSQMMLAMLAAIGVALPPKQQRMTAPTDAEEEVAAFADEE